MPLVNGLNIQVVWSFSGMGRAGHQTELHFT